MIFKPRTENTVISISGGRTSAYLLKKVLDECGGSLPQGCLAIFQNTGKEKEATYRFVEEISNEWGVPIVWLEYAGKKKFKVVDFETANRTGEPFKQAIIDNSYYLPNAMQRTCSMTLKNKTMSYYLTSLGWKEVENLVGIRADEPKRFSIEGVAYEKDAEGNTKTFKDGTPKRVNRIIDEEKYLPLRHAGITKPEILDFWKNNSFDLEMGPNESNCDLCFMKGVDNLLSELRRDPSLADWWIEMENLVSEKRGPSVFRKDRPSYKKLKVIATDNPDLFFDDTDNLPCNCTD